MARRHQQRKSSNRKRKNNNNNNNGINALSKKQQEFKQQVVNQIKNTKWHISVFEDWHPPNCGLSSEEKKYQFFVDKEGIKKNGHTFDVGEYETQMMEGKMKNSSTAGLLPFNDKIDDDDDDDDETMFITKDFKYLVSAQVTEISSNLEDPFLLSCNNVKSFGDNPQTLNGHPFLQTFYPDKSFTTKRYADDDDDEDDKDHNEDSGGDNVDGNDNEYDEGSDGYDEDDGDEEDDDEDPYENNNNNYNNNTNPGKRKITVTDMRLNERRQFRDRITKIMYILDNLKMKDYASTMKSSGFIDIESDDDLLLRLLYLYEQFKDADNQDLCKYIKSAKWYTEGVDDTAENDEGDTYDDDEDVYDDQSGIDLNSIVCMYQITKDTWKIIVNYFNKLKREMKTRRLSLFKFKILNVDIGRREIVNPMVYTNQLLMQLINLYQRENNANIERVENENVEKEKNVIPLTDTTSECFDETESVTQFDNNPMTLRILHNMKNRRSVTINVKFTYISRNK